MDFRGTPLALESTGGESHLDELFCFARGLKGEGRDEGRDERKETEGKEGQGGGRKTENRHPNQRQEDEEGRRHEMGGGREGTPAARTPRPEQDRQEAEQ